MAVGEALTNLFAADVTDLSRVVLSRLRVDNRAIERFVPGADFIACGHSHFDHAMDAPAIAARFGATVIGSASTAALCEASGLAADRRIEVPAEGATLDAVLEEALRLWRATFGGRPRLGIGWLDNQLRLRRCR